jgi:hypothetical protein
MSWRIARALETLRSQVNAKWPERRKDSDGSVGDTSHAARPSDHNPDANGVVKAIDITHDPKGGFDSYAFADMLLRNKDQRIKYVISNGRIGSGAAGPSPWKWRKYTGSNRHDHHVHISVVADRAKYDDTAPWRLAGLPQVDPAAAEEFVRPPATVAPGASGADVERLQKLLGCAVTGKYEPRSETEFALRLFQVRHKLDPDGKAGPQTWKALA